LNDKKETALPVNEQIRAPKVQVITQEGENIGVVSREQALRMAREANLDLMMVSERGSDGVPIAKIIDYGKVLYAKKKKQAEAKKHQKVVQVKEIKMRPKIGEHDFQTKIKQGIQFLKEGKYLKVTLMFRGREAALSKERGPEMFEKIEQAFKDHELTNVEMEKDSKMGALWSRIYMLKQKK
jgi:translation initiation factor IF-3